MSIEEFSRSGGDQKNPPSPSTCMCPSLARPYEKREGLPIGLRERPPRLVSEGSCARRAFEPEFCQLLSACFELSLRMSMASFVFRPLPIYQARRTRGASNFSLPEKPGELPNPPT